MTNNNFLEGDKVTWSTNVSGKIVVLKGDVSSINGETLCCIGKCVNGNWWRDYVSIYSANITRL